MPRNRYRYEKKRKPSRTGSGALRIYGTVLTTLVLFVLSAFFVAPQYFGSVVPESWRAPFRLGLDLQGGTHLEYEADMSDIPDGEKLKALEGVKDVIERRVNAFGVAEPVVQTTTTGGNHRVIIELAGVLDVNDAINLIGETPILEFKEPGEELDREPTEEELAEFELKVQEDRDAAADVLRRARNLEDFDGLIDEFQGSQIGPITEEHLFYGDFVTEVKNTYLWQGGTLNKVLETEAGLHIVKYNKLTDVDEMELQHLLICFEGKTRCQNPIPALDASLTINKLKDEATVDNFADIVRENSTEPGAAEGAGNLGWAGPGQYVPAFELEANNTAVGEFSNIVETEFGYHLILKKGERSSKAYDLSQVVMPITKITDVVPPVSPWKNTGLSGKQLTRAAVEFDQTTGVPNVGLTFDSEGDKLFGDLTGRLVGQPIAIFLDGEIISAPTVQQAIYGGTAVITGNFSLEESKVLAQRLNAGALPVPVELLSQQTVGPTLGQISLQKSITAGLIGFLMVALFMLLYYRVPGVLAVLALIIYTTFNLAVYKMLDVTITLAGIAGFILSVGMAVDANVLIFERMKEELRAGRGLRSSIDEGFRRAWTSIRDGNLTTLIAAAVLFWFSTSFIKGFALTLSIGILLSMLTAVGITRIWLQMISRWGWLKKTGLYARIKQTQE